jgi:hypothetical protein
MAIVVVLNLIRLVQQRVLTFGNQILIKVQTYLKSIIDMVSLNRKWTF